jgi:hypothetical protein
MTIGEETQGKKIGQEVYFKRPFFLIRERKKVSHKFITFLIRFRTMTKYNNK